MGVISILWGVLALVWTLLAFIPLLGWGNWLMIPFAAVGALLAVLGVMLHAPGNRGTSKAGLVLNVLCIAIGMFRLSIGGGII